MSLTHAIVLTTLALGAGQPAPLPATGKWTVNFAESMCVAEHDFGPEDKPTILALRPAPLGQSIEVRVSEADPAYVSRTDAGTVTLLPSGRAYPARMTSFGPVTNGRRLTRFYLEGVEVNDLVSAGTIRIDRGRAGSPVVLAPSGAAGVISAMTRCGDGLLRRWGLDPVAMHGLSRQPRPVGGSERDWFKPKDYPKAARGNLRSGRTLALVTIGIDGRVSKCNIAESAGNPDLDGQTCGILTDRGRYEPGLDAAGTPVSSQKLVGVMWALWPFYRR